MKLLSSLTLLLLFGLAKRISANQVSRYLQGGNISNDLCVDAIPIAVGGATVYENFTYATVDRLEVPSNCFDANKPSRPGVWYSFVGTGGTLVARSCAISVGTSISIYRGSCGAANLQCVAGATSLCGRERFFFNTTQGTMYYVLLQSYIDSVDLSIFVPPSVENDVCANAKPFVLGSNVSVDSTYARSDALDVPSNCYDTNKPSVPGVWYSVVGTGGPLVTRSCFESYTGTYISIYKGNCGAATLICVSGTFNACRQDRFFFNTTQNTTYYVLLQSLYDDSLVDLSIFVPPPVENDVCVNAKPFVLGSNVSSYFWSATSDALEVPSNCYDAYKPYSPGVWYSFVGTGGPLIARSCSVPYTFISIYQGNCGAATLKCVVGTTTPCAPERFFFNTTQNTTYYVLFQSVYSTVVGDLSIFVPPPVENDVCVNAKPFILGSNVSVDSTYARSDALEVPSECFTNKKPSIPGVWYRLVGTGGLLVAKSCSEYTTYLSIYQGNCGAATLKCVAGTFYACGQEPFFFNTTLGTMYYVLLQSYYDKVVELSIFAASSVENDLCVNAKPIALGSTVLVNHTYATSDELDVFDNCTGLAPPVNPGVWYSFNGTGRKVSIDTCNSTASVVVSVYVGNCSSSSLQCVAVGNRLCNGNILSFSTESDRKYRALVQALTDGRSVLKLYEPTVNPVPTPPRPAPRPAPAPAPTPTGRPVIIIAWIRGDPHITTMDGLEYDCQARGEFTLLKSRDSTFQVQSRFTNVKSSSVENSVASVTSGIAIRESDEAPLIQVSLLPDSSANTVDGCFESIQLYENGNERPLSSGASSSMVTVSVANDEIIIVFVGSGVEVHLYVKSSETFGCFLTHWIYLPENYRSQERFVGLLGNMNGNPSDDWITNAGEILPTPNSNEAMFQRAYDYCREEWCIRSVSDSLFTYGEDESFASYFDCDKAYAPGLEDAVKNASDELKRLCGENVECIIDGVIGSISDAQALLNDTARIEDEIENRMPPKSCGIFERSIFCPLTFQGFFGRLIRRIIGGS